MLRNLFNIIAVLGSIASIIALIALGSDDIEKAKELLFSIEAFILISISVVGFVTASGLFILLPRYKRRYSPNCGEISWIQFLKILNPATSRYIVSRFLKFQSLMVQNGPSRKNYTCISDKHYKKEIFDQFFKHIKRTIDDYTSADVSVQIKLFPIDKLKDSAVGGFSNSSRDLGIEFLSHYHSIESGSNSSAPRRTGEYKIRTSGGNAKQLRQLVDKSEIKCRAEGAERRECSALNKAISINRPYWIGNDVTNKIYKDQFFSNSPHQESHYKSMAVFAITRYVEDPPEDETNPPWGFLIIQSNEVDRFDDVLMPSIGMYYANRIFFFLYHTFTQAKNPVDEQEFEQGSGGNG